MELNIYDMRDEIHILTDSIISRNLFIYGNKRDRTKVVWDILRNDIFVLFFMLNFQVKFFSVMSRRSHRFPDITSTFGE